MSHDFRPTLTGSPEAYGIGTYARYELPTYIELMLPTKEKLASACRRVSSCREITVDDVSRKTGIDAVIVETMFLTGDCTLAEGMKVLEAIGIIPVTLPAEIVFGG